MSKRWIYGGYEFTINPKSQSSEYELVGDDVRTLTGAVISQPTSLTENHSLVATLYKPRTRISSEVSIQNGLIVKYYNEKFYVLNKVNDVIDVYSKNLILESSLSLASVIDKNFVGLEVESDIIWVISDNGSDLVYKLDLSGNLLSTHTITKTGLGCGVAVSLGYMWIIRQNGILDKVRMSDFTIVSNISMPAGLFYSGITADGDFLAIGDSGNTEPVIYYIDPITSKLIGSIECGRQPEIKSITKDDNNYYIYDLSTETLKTLKANTVDIDVYRISKEIEFNRFVTMIDDMGISRRVTCTNLNISRSPDHERMYTVSINISVVNRG